MPVRCRCKHTHADHMLHAELCWPFPCRSEGCECERWNPVSYPPERAEEFE